MSKETKFNQSKIMKAVRIHNYGGPEVLQYEEAPLPQPQAGEIRLLVHAAGVNPFDWKVRSGYLKDYIPHTFPLILGWDVSGVVDEAGPGASRFKKGDEVFCLADTTRDGAYAEYIVVPEAAVALKAKSQHHANAAAMPVGALTAWQALFDKGGLQGGQRILIHGGAGGVGHLAVQLAKWKGAHVITTASAKNHDWLRDLGTDEVIDYTRQRFEDSAGKVDVVLDTMGGETQERSWQVLKKGGILVSLIQPPSEDTAKAKGVRGVIVGVSPDGTRLAEIAGLVDAGKLKPAIDRIIPLTEVRRAHKLSQSGHIRGKIVLRVNETA